MRINCKVALWRCCQNVLTRIQTYNCYFRNKMGVVAANFNTNIFIVNEIKGKKEGGNSKNE